MKTSESLGKIAPALVKAQAAISHAAIDAANPHFKSRYASLPSVIDAIKPALIENGIAFVQFAEDSPNGSVLNLTTRLLHSSGEWIESTTTVPLSKTDPQGYGSALTYARRYTLAAVVGLYADEDDDAEAATHRPTKPVVKAVPKAEDPAFDVESEILALGCIDDIDALRSALVAVLKRAPDQHHKRLKAEAKAISDQIKGAA